MRAALAVALIAAVLLGALVAAISALNREVYSAAGFVGQYLDALDRKDTAGALALPGATPSDAELAAANLPQKLPTTLLRASVLGGLSDIELRSDVETAPGKHTVVYDFRLDGKRTSMEFRVEQAGTFALVFDSWKFQTSPLAVLQVTVLHAAAFSVNGLDLDTRAHAPADAPAAFSSQAAYLAFAPAVYSFRHDSPLLAAAERAVPIARSGATDVSVDALPNQKFHKQVQTELNSFLDKCVTDQVLQPANCPYGITINDRILGLPVWSIADYPDVVLTPGETTFDMPDSPGLAHIVVQVQSLFDGEEFTRDEDVPFTIGLSVTIRPDGALAIQLH